MTVAVAVPSRGDGTADAELAALARALGHPARVAIIRLLLGREACFCGEIVEHLPLAQATVSQHLKVLRQVGLIRGEIEGPRVCYWADRTALERAQALLGALRGDSDLQGGCA